MSPQSKGEPVPPPKKSDTILPVKEKETVIKTKKRETVLPSDKKTIKHLIQAIQKMPMMMDFTEPTKAKDPAKAKEPAKPKIGRLEFEGKIWHILVLSENNPYYLIGKKLGKGGQGIVYIGLNLESEKKVAIKKYLYTTTVEVDVEREERNLQLCKRWLGTTSDVIKNQYVVMVYHPGNNLLHHLYEINSHESPESLNRYTKKPLDIILKARIILKVLEEYLCFNSRMLIHRDIKPANIILDPEGSMKITFVDLVNAVHVDEPLKAELKALMGNSAYTAPELCVSAKLRPPHGFNQDSWSVGMVLAEIASNINYQAAQQHLATQKVGRANKNEFTEVEMKTMLPDVFNNNLLVERDTTAGLAHLNKAMLGLKIKLLIGSLTHSDPSQRPAPQKIKEYHEDLNRQLEMVWTEPANRPSTEPANRPSVARQSSLGNLKGFFLGNSSPKTSTPRDGGSSGEQSPSSPGSGRAVGKSSPGHRIVEGSSSPPSSHYPQRGRGGSGSRSYLISPEHPTRPPDVPRLTLQRSNEELPKIKKP